MNRISNCWDRFGKEYVVWDEFLYFRFCYSFSYSQQLKILESRNQPREKKLGHMKYPRNKISDPRNTHEKKFWTNKIPTRKNFGVTKYIREKILDPQNIHKKKFWSHKIAMRKKFEPTKYSREKILNSRNTYKDMVARWH